MNSVFDSVVYYDIEKKRRWVEKLMFNLKITIISHQIENTKFYLNARA